MKALRDFAEWLDRVLSDRQVMLLLVAIILLFLLLWWIGWYLAPVLVGLFLSFLMHGSVTKLAKWRIPELVAILILMTILTGALVALVFWVVPLVVRQGDALILAVPSVMYEIETVIVKIELTYPELIPEGTSAYVAGFLQSHARTLVETLPRTLVAQVPNVFALLIYTVLVPVCTFFFLKDRRVLLAWFQSILPRNRDALERVGREMQVQLGRYIRGKFLEILIVAGAAYIAFRLLGLNYAALLATLVGLSVLIPLVGAAVVTVPVVIVALIQFGWSAELLYVIVAYTVIQTLDGNVLVPLLFSEVMHLHPIAIIIAILAFGGIWGFWGVFFAIPLAILVKSVLDVWRPSTSLAGESSL